MTTIARLQPAHLNARLHVFDCVELHTRIRDCSIDVIRLVNATERSRIGLSVVYRVGQWAGKSRRSLRRNSAVCPAIIYHSMSHHTQSSPQTLGKVPLCLWRGGWSWIPRLASYVHTMPMTQIVVIESTPRGFNIAVRPTHYTSPCDVCAANL